MLDQFLNRLKDLRDRRLIHRIQKRKLTYLSERKMALISKTCRAIEARKLDGTFIEAGCALGGSAILISSIKRPGRPFLGYDTFAMIPPPSADDTPDVHRRYEVIASGASKGIEGDEYYGYQDHLYERVQQNFADFGLNCSERNITLIQGLLQERMTIKQPVAFAHIDVDWYDPVKTCLERIFPNLIVGGSVILDDYHDWGGCRKAADAFLQTVAGQYLLADTEGSLQITKR